MHNGRPHNPEPPADSRTDDGDATLVRRFVKCRDEPAFAELVRRYSGLVYGVAQRVLHQQQDVEDVFQATFLVLARDAAGIRNRASIAGWLYGVAHRLALKARAGRQRRAGQPLQDETMNHADPFSEIAQRSDLQVLDEELNELPAKYREALVRHYLMDRTAPQIAADLQLSVAAVEGRLKRGRDRLRKRLARRGVGLAVVLGVLELCRQSAVAAPHALVAQTVSAGLSYTTSGQSPTSCSPQAAQLAAKEIGTMTMPSVGTTTALTISAAVLIALTAGLAGQTVNADPAREPGVDAVDLPTSPSAAALPVIQVAAPANPANAKTKTKPGGAFPVKVVGTPRPTLDYRRKSVAEEKIYQELSNKTQIDFIDTPLKDAIEFLADLHGVQILVDKTGLADAGVKTDTPITLVLKNVRLESVLAIILHKRGLEYLVRNEVLEITTKSVADKHTETHLYELRHIEHVTPDDIVKIIRETIHPDSWRPADGKPADAKKKYPGSITAVGGALIVTHTQRVNREVEDLLTMLAHHSPHSKLEKAYEDAIRRKR